MRFTGADLVASWGGANAVLVGVHIWFGGGVDGSIPLALYGGAVLLTELVAVAAWWTLRYRPGITATSAAPRTSRIALWGGLAAAFVVAGFVWGYWLMAPAAYPLLGVAVEFASSGKSSRWRARIASSSGSGGTLG